ncbi:uncharacterized protein LOC144120336 [Amblyomma americanum]
MASKARTGFVPGCKSGYRSCPVKASLFRAPIAAARRELWARNIKRADKELTSDCVVCERHFEEKFIERTFRHVIGGKVVDIPRDRPHLKDDAAPTVFPDAPKYFTKKAPTKRKERNLCEQKAPSSKRRKLHAVADAQLPTQQDADDSIVAVPDAQDDSQEADLHYFCGNLYLPDGCWSKLRLSAESDTVYIGVCERGGDNIAHMLLPKLIKFRRQRNQVGPVLCSVFVRGKLHSECVFTSSAEAQAVVDHTHSLVMCTGSGMTPANTRRYVAFGASYFATSCTLTCKGQGPCVPCKYLRKLVQNQVSRKTLCRIRTNRLKKHAHTRRRLQTVQKKLRNTTRELEEMRLANKNTATEILNDRIKALPPKQQQAVMTCFKAAARKSTCGMRYEKDWILECVLMRMRSPKLYEHLRKQKILILPSRTCLQRYIQNFKSGFGFNENVFKALALETGDMDINARHGGIVFDEMKLSEHFSVNTAGAVQGFVDLGKFTPEDEMTTPADHGMVMLFQPFQGDWTQILGVFSSKGNIKAEMLSKLLLEAIILTEQAGLFVDFVTCDGATWNRSMWKSFGITGEELQELQFS